MMKPLPLPALAPLAPLHRPGTLGALAPVSTPSTRPLHAWANGAAAARSGTPVTACPHAADTYHFVTWHNGWAATMHEIARGR